MEDKPNVFLLGIGIIVMGLFFVAGLAFYGLIGLALVKYIWGG